MLIIKRSNTANYKNGCNLRFNNTLNALVESTSLEAIEESVDCYSRLAPDDVSLIISKYFLILYTITTRNSHAATYVVHIPIDI